MRDDVIRRIDALRKALDSARSVPLSASVMVNRHELFELLAELEMTIDETLSHASEVVGERDAFVDTGRIEAVELLREAERKRDDLLSDTDVFKLAQLRGAEVVAEAAQEAARLRADADAYVEEKLANLELTLTKTADRMVVGRSQVAKLDAAELEELKVETEQYVVEKLTEFEELLRGAVQVLHKGRAQIIGGHVHGLGDDTDVAEISLSEHLER